MAKIRDLIEGLRHTVDTCTNLQSFAFAFVTMYCQPHNYLSHLEIWAIR